MRKILLAFLISGWISSSPEVYFIEPKNGDVVSNTFTVKFGLSNFGIAPAGYDLPMTGHHHLLINVDLLNALASLRRCLLLPPPVLITKAIFFEFKTSTI